MIGPSETGIYGKLHVGPTGEMTAASQVAGPAPTAPAGLPPGVKIIGSPAELLAALHEFVAAVHPKPPPPAPAPSPAQPTTGIWAFLHAACPWRSVFPLGWVPVTQLTASPVASGWPVWIVDLKRTSLGQQVDLARLLERRGLGQADETLLDFARGTPPAMLADFVTRVQDFDTGSCAVVEIKTHGGGQ